MNRHPELSLRESVYLSVSIRFSKGEAEPNAIMLIPNSCINPFGILMPLFCQIIKASSVINIESFIEKGDLSSAITRYYEYWENGSELFSEDVLKTLQGRKIADSYLGGLCFYKYGDEYLLEIKLTATNETFVETVRYPDMLIQALNEIEREFTQFMVTYCELWPYSESEL